MWPSLYTFQWASLKLGCICHKAFFPSYATVQTAKAAYKDVLSDVGASMPFLIIMIRASLKKQKAAIPIQEVSES